MRRALVLPHAEGNPYQQLLYGEATREFEILFSGPGGLGGLDRGDVSVVHIHWDDRMFGRSKDPEKNRAVLEGEMARLERFRAGGGRIVWTIHNRLPHKIVDLGAFKEARHRLSALADVIHVHADHARDHMIAAYAADRDKIGIVPHPSYLGSYEPADTALARKLTEDTARRFLFFGMFRGDKGVHEIEAAAAKLTKRGYDYDLKMYGKAFGSQARLLRRLGANPRIDLRTDRIPDEEIAEIFGSSHVFLAPYRALFTSGTVMLAMTFGLPVVGPNIPALRESLPEPCYDLLYDPDAPRGLIWSLIRFIAMPDVELADYRTACFDFARARAPNVIGKEISALLDARAS